MIITKKLNRKEKKELTIAEFKKQYKADLDAAIKDFIKSENEKQQYLPKIMQNKTDESDFYLSLHFNFNHHNHDSEWFIEKI